MIYLTITAFSVLVLVLGGIQIRVDTTLAQQFLMGDLDGQAQQIADARMQLEQGEQELPEEEEYEDMEAELDEETAAEEAEMDEE